MYFFHQDITPDRLLKPNKQFAQELLKQKTRTSQKDQPITQKNEMNIKDWQDECKSLELELNMEKERTRALDQEIQDKQETYVRREIEFKDKITHLQTQLKQASQLGEGDKKNLDLIRNYHDRLQDTISNIHQKTAKLMYNQERDIMRFFINKINEIKKDFEQEREEKTKKDLKYLEKENQLSAQLEWIKDIAQKINHENLKLHKNYQELRQQYKTQESDREVLLKDLLLIQKQNASLKQKIEQQQHIASEKERIKEQNLTEFGSEQQSDHMDEQSQFQNYDSKVEITLQQQKIKKIQKQIRDLKQQYVTELKVKSSVEKVLRDTIQDIKQEMIKLKQESRFYSHQEDHEKQIDMQDRLITNEKMLLLIYDKIFHNEYKLSAISEKDMILDI